jgi:hypothetical protein
MLGNRLQHIREPAPILQHLAWRLIEITGRRRAMETRIAGFRNQIMDSMAQLMEQKYHMPVLQEVWFTL